MYIYSIFFGTYLGARGNDALVDADGGSPSDVPHPVGVRLQLGLLDPATALGVVEAPQLDEVIAAAGDEAPETRFNSIWHEKPLEKLQVPNFFNFFNVSGSLSQYSHGFLFPS